MLTNSMTPLEIRRQGLNALVQSLGPVGMVRFLQQFELGQGNYSKERARLLAGVTLAEVMAQIRQGRATS